MPSRNAYLLIAGIVIGLLCASRVETTPHARYVRDAFELIESRSLEDPRDEELFVGAMRGMVAVLRARGDEHSGYLAPQSAEPLRAEMRQQFGGVGVRIALEGEPPVVTVVEPPQPGTPAYASPLRSRDVIVAVDGDPTAGKPLGEVVGQMRGPLGEAVELTVRHEGDETTETFSLTREVIRVPSIVGDRRGPGGEWLHPLAEHPGVALVRITSFGNRTASELAELLTRLTREEGIERYVLDVRGNAGGALDAAVDVCALFLEAGQEIVSTRGRDGEVIDRYAAPADGPFLGLRLAILIDRDTASAAEIVAAALDDNLPQAVVVGERSYGKGTVQQLLPLEAGRSLLKLTAASYWRPSGVNIHRSPGDPESAEWGVKPDEGFQIDLTDEQRVTWFTWRRQRDLVVDPSVAAGGDANGATDPSEPPSLAEVDPMLAAAVDALLAPGVSKPDTARSPDASGRGGTR